MIAARPFLKWAGGKTQLLDALLARAPERIDTYYEPFLGGGALFFALMANPDRPPRHAVLNDLNHDLITVYEVVRDRVEALIAALERLAEDYLRGDDATRSAFYYDQRASQPADPVELAARFIFLNKTCFNGLYRVNRRGEFNVPHGRYRSPRILDTPGLRAASAALGQVTLTTLDFREALRAPKAGDFVYLDPPFEPLSKTSSFTGYTPSGFGRQDQLELRQAVDALTDRGVNVLLSNSGHEWVIGLYEGAFRYRLAVAPAKRPINSRGEKRGDVPELILANYEQGRAVSNGPLGFNGLITPASR